MSQHIFADDRLFNLLEDRFIHQSDFVSRLNEFTQIRRVIPNMIVKVLDPQRTKNNQYRYCCELSFKGEEYRQYGCLDVSPEQHSDRKIRNEIMQLLKQNVSKDFICKKTSLQKDRIDFSISSIGFMPQIRITLEVVTAVGIHDVAGI